MVKFEFIDKSDQVYRYVVLPYSVYLFKLSYNDLYLEEWHWNLIYNRLIDISLLPSLGLLSLSRRYEITESTWYIDVVCEAYVEFLLGLK